MKRVIVPVNDAGEGDALARKAIERYRREPVEIQLLNVQRPLPLHIAQFFGRDELADVHRQSGLRVLEAAARLLDEASVPHETHVLVGKPAETIVRFAEANPGAEILMDTAPPGLLSRLGIGSIASQVHHLLASHSAGAAPEATTR